MGWPPVYAARNPRHPTRSKSGLETILVVNHALFFTDLALRREDVSILPKYDAVILDEAHTVEAVAGETGGRVYYLRQMEVLDEAYAEIGAELRSQYLLAYTTEHRLSDEELLSLKVRVDGDGRKVRTVVGGRTLE